MNHCTNQGFRLGNPNSANDEERRRTAQSESAVITSSLLTKQHRLKFIRFPDLTNFFVSLSGGTIFSTLDLSYAYNQLDDKAQELTTINTYKGLYKYTRLSFGVASVPAIFQQQMEILLKDLPMTCVYVDDILVGGNSPQDHLNNLTAVLIRLQEAGLRLKRENAPSVFLKWSS